MKELWSPTNALYIWDCFTKAFQSLDFVIVPSGGPDSDEFEVRKLCKDIQYPECHNEWSTDYHGQKLKFRNKERPANKFLYLYGLLAMLKPRNKMLKECMEEVKKEFARHNETWGTEGQWIREEMLLALNWYSGCDIPMSHAIPAIADAGINPRLEWKYIATSSISGQRVRISKETRHLAKLICKTTRISDAFSWNYT